MDEKVAKVDCKLLNLTNSFFQAMKIELREPTITTTAALIKSHFSCAMSFHLLVNLQNEIDDHTCGAHWLKSLKWVSDKDCEQ